VHLPSAAARAIGTRPGAVHLERHTPSETYQRTGQRQIVARDDLGFGHPGKEGVIQGMAELKVVGSLDAQLSQSLKGGLPQAPGPGAR
jgi:hypothetical protein